MQSSLHIGTFFNIPVKIHWTFGFLVVFVIYIGFLNDLYWNEILAFGLYVLVLFLCVIFHEYGHALMARKYGVTTRDIILSPIGGIARLENIPEEPVKELMIALAGPAVNVLLAIVLSLIAVFVFNGSVLPTSSDLELLVIPSEFISFVIIMNIALFVFNLVPAFPMDGGRVLRSLLAMKWGRLKATQIAQLIGKIIAIVFVIIGLMYGHIMLGLIGLFIYFTAGSETKGIAVHQLLRNTEVGVVMRTTYTQLHLNDPISVAIDSVKRGGEKNFLVSDSMGNISGMLDQDVLVYLIKSGENIKDKIAAHYLSPYPGSVSTSVRLSEILELMQKNKTSLVAVKEREKVIGVVDKEIINDYINLYT